MAASWPGQPARAIFTHFLARLYCHWQPAADSLVSHYASYIFSLASSHWYWYRRAVRFVEELVGCREMLSYRLMINDETRYFIDTPLSRAFSAPAIEGWSLPLMPADSLRRRLTPASRTADISAEFLSSRGRRRICFDAAVRRQLPQLASRHCMAAAPTPPFHAFSPGSRRSRFHWWFSPFTARPRLPDCICEISSIFRFQHLLIFRPAFAAVIDVSFFRQLSGLTLILAWCHWLLPLPLNKILILFIDISLSASSPALQALRAEIIAFTPPYDYFERMDTTPTCAFTHTPSRRRHLRIDYAVSLSHWAID